MIPVVELIRLETGPSGTLGVLLIQKKIFAVTLEPPDRLNKTNISHIPSGQYICDRQRSPRYGNTFLVRDVPGRSHILFHAGNVVEDTQGCILLGSTVGKLRSSARAVLNSGATFTAYMAALEGHDRFHLTIREFY